VASDSNHVRREGGGRSTGLGGLLGAKLLAEGAAKRAEERREGEAVGRRRVGRRRGPLFLCPSRRGTLPQLCSRHVEAPSPPPARFVAWDPPPTQQATARSHLLAVSASQLAESRTAAPSGTRLPRSSGSCPVPRPGGQFSGSPAGVSGVMVPSLRLFSPFVLPAPRARGLDLDLDRPRLRRPRPSSCLSAARRVGRSPFHHEDLYLFHVSPKSPRRSGTTAPRPGVSPDADGTDEGPDALARRRRRRRGGLALPIVRVRD